VRNDASDMESQPIWMGVAATPGEIDQERCEV
jgi:hypothetical protein